MIIGLQIAGIFFGLIMLYFTYLHYRRREFQSNEFAIWVIAWLVFIITSAFPSYISYFSRAFSISNRIDFLIIAALFFVIAITFHNFSVLKKNQKKLETVVRKMAMAHESKKNQ